ncbi:MAG: TrmH family RNA methyltransferase [Cyanobacteriota bacterium]|nr:TrmH family RNA methyltransferase [Cyanobacteriota bacterium]
MLVEPSGPRNVGSVARAIANFNGAPLKLQLRLVAPRCDHGGDEARRMAVHAVSVLERALVFPSLASALADCGRVVATTGRGEGEPLPPSPPDEALTWLLGADARTGTALVFGREDRGLSRDELLLAGRLLRIQTGPAYSSLNLAQAAAVALQRLRALSVAEAGASRGVLTQGEPARRDRLEALLADAESLLLDVGFLHPHTAHARMAKLRGLLQRGQVDDAEVALLRGMVRQMRWACRRLPQDTGTP